MIKKIKIKTAGRLLIVLAVIFLCQADLLAQAQFFIGPDQIYPETNNSYTRPAPMEGVANGDWVCSTPSAIIPNGDGVILRVNSAYSNCTITLSYERRVATSATGTDVAVETVTFSVLILPFVIMPPLYPGETLTLSIKDNCSQNCGYEWNVSPQALCPSCFATGTNTQVIYIDPYNIPADYVSVSCIAACTPALSDPALPQVTSPVVLRAPTIAGQHSVGCAGSTQQGDFVYTADHQLGANWYQWHLPSFLDYTMPNGNNNTATISVIENATGTGNITLQTFYAQGSAIHSSIVVFSVQVCCRTQLNVTNNVPYYAVDQQQSAITMTANNVINNTASAMYHTGETLALENGFHAMPNSYFHGYIQACNTSFSRLADPANNAGDNGAAPVTENNKLQSAFTGNSNEPTASILPNPTTGIFIVKCIGTEYPKQIIIRDVMGRDIKVINNPGSYSTQFDLEKEVAGVYLVSIYYSDKVISKRVIKN